MTPDINDDFDVDNQDDFDKGAAERASVKDMWDSNPLLKIAAVVLGVAVLAGAYMTFMGGVDPADNISSGPLADKAVKQVAATAELDDEYKQAIEDQNKKQAEEAMVAGGSAIPTPIATAQDGGIDIADQQAKNASDPLAEWRQQAEAARQEEDLLPPEDELDQMDPNALPENVAMVQPVRPQAVMKMDPEAAKALSTQMRTIISAQVPLKANKATITARESAYKTFMKQEATAKANAARAATTGGDGLGGGGVAASAGSSRSKTAGTKTIIPAGAISYAQTINQLNSDIEGPVLAQVLSGPFAGGRALGEFETKDEYLVISFRRIIKDGVSYNVNAIALNEDTTLAAHQTDVDRHYFTRVILPAAAKFVEGYGSAVAETGTSSTVTAGGGVVQDQPEPDAGEEVYKGVEEASAKVSEILDAGAERPITVHVAKGTTMGLLFMDPVTTANAGK
jgi:intracellular multiplication protein IcmE